METAPVEAVVAIAGMRKDARATVALTPRVLGAINDGKLRRLDGDAAGESASAEGSETGGTADEPTETAPPAKRAQRSRRPRD